MDKRLIDILACPEKQTPLAEAEGPLLAKLNHAISAGQIKNRGGTTLQQPIAAGLVREGGDYLYPIVDDIPVLLIDEAIALDQITA